MMTSTSLHWAHYPQKLLNHSILHLQLGSEFDLKMAMICIDNAVEITLKEYLNYINAKKIDPHSTFSDILNTKNSFFKLVEMCIKYKTEIIDEDDINCVLRFHDIRNDMYHAGSGITVERRTVEEYLEISKLIFFGLYGTDLDVDTIQLREQKLGIYLNRYTEFSKLFRNSLRERGDEQAYYWKMDLCLAIGNTFFNEYSVVRWFHEMIVSSYKDCKDSILTQMSDKLTFLLTNLKDFINTPKYQDYLCDKLSLKPRPDSYTFPSDIISSLMNDD